jgi:hypothetical protein
VEVEGTLQSQFQVGTAKIHCLGWHLVGNTKVIGTTSAGGLQDNAIPAGDGFDDGIRGRRQRTDQWMTVRHVVKST